MSRSEPCNIKHTEQIIYLKKTRRKNPLDFEFFVMLSVDANKLQKKMVQVVKYVPSKTSMIESVYKNRFWTYAPIGLPKVF